jgi:hypothetical protein
MTKVEAKISGAFRISGVGEVGGAFVGGVHGEDFGAGVGDGVACRGAGLSEQGLELGEDLLDRIEVGQVFLREDKPRADGAGRLSPGLPLVGAEIVEDHDVAGLEGRGEKLFDIEASALTPRSASRRSQSA